MATKAKATRAPRAKATPKAPLSATERLLSASDRHVSKVHAEGLVTYTEQAMPGEGTFAEKHAVLTEAIGDLLNMIGTSPTLRQTMLDTMVANGVPKSCAIEAIASFTYKKHVAVTTGTGKIIGGDKSPAREATKAIPGKLYAPINHVPVFMLRKTWARLLNVPLVHARTKKPMCLTSEIIVAAQKLGKL